MKTIAVTRVLTETEINALHTTQINIVSAPGANKVFIPESVVLKRVGAVASTGTNNLNLLYSGGTALSMVHYRADAVTGVLANTNGAGIKVVTGVESSATANGSIAEETSALSVNKAFGVKAAGAITAGSGSTLMVTVIGYVLNV